MRKAGKALAQVVDRLRSSLKIGMTTREVDELGQRLIEEKKARPAFKGYRGFPAAVCTSFNEEVVHGIPGSRRIDDGDILSIDVGLVLEGWFADMAFTKGFGNLPSRVEKLVEVTERSCTKGSSR